HTHSSIHLSSPLSLFFFHHTAPTDTYPLSLHDALPISRRELRLVRGRGLPVRRLLLLLVVGLVLRQRGRHLLRLVLPLNRAPLRSEEHTSELQSLTNLVCRLLLEKKKKTTHTPALQQNS